MSAGHLRTAELCVAIRCKCKKIEFKSAVIIGEMTKFEQDLTK